MIVAIGAVAMLGIVVVWYLIARDSRAAVVSRADFDREYDQLVANGEAVEGEPDVAWRDFHNWQAESERERLEWEEAPDE